MKNVFLVDGPKSMTPDQLLIIEKLYLLAAVSFSGDPFYWENHAYRNGITLEDGDEILGEAGLLISQLKTNSVA